MYPLFLNLEGRTCLVVGGGGVARRKIEPLLASGAKVVVVAPEIQSAIETLAVEERLDLRRRPFEPEDLAGCVLVIAATSDEETNRRVFASARSRGVLCNVVDAPALCDFHVPAVVRRGDLRIAVSTAGKSPAFASRVRRELERLYPERAGAALERLGRIRASTLARPDLTEADRKAFLTECANCEALDDFLAGRTDALEIEDIP